MEKNSMAARVVHERTRPQRSSDFFLQLRRTYISQWQHHTRCRYVDCSMHKCSAQIRQKLFDFLCIYSLKYTRRFVLCTLVILGSLFSIAFSYKILDTDKWRTIYISTFLLSQTHFVVTKAKQQRRHETHAKSCANKGKFIKNYCHFFLVQDFYLLLQFERSNKMIFRIWYLSCTTATGGWPNSFKYRVHSHIGPLWIA